MAVVFDDDLEDDLLDGEALGETAGAGADGSQPPAPQPTVPLERPRWLPEGCTVIESFPPGLGNERQPVSGTGGGHHISLRRDRSRDGLGGGPPEAVPPAPALPDNKECSICDELKAASEFSKGARLCKPCSADVEAFQRRLKSEWGKEYKRKYAEIKKDKASYKASVREFQARNMGRTKRALHAAAESLLHVKQKGKMSNRRRKKKNLSFAAFKAYYMEERHGGYTAEQVAKKWEKDTSNQQPVDMKGVIRGTPGHKRFRFELSSTSASEDFEQEHQQHQEGTKVAKELPPEDVEDFMVGKAVFGDDDAALPESLTKEGSSGAGALLALPDGSSAAGSLALALADPSVAASPAKSAQSEDVRSEATKAEPPAKKQRAWRRANAIANATAKVATSTQELRNTAECYKVQAATAGAASDALSPECRARFENYANVHNIARAALDLVIEAGGNKGQLRAAQAELPKVEGNTAADAGSSAGSLPELQACFKGLGYLDFFPDFRLLVTLPVLEAFSPRLEAATSAEELAEVSKEFATAKSVCQALLRGVRQSTSDIQKHIDKAVAYEKARQAQAVADLGSGSGRAGGQPPSNAGSRPTAQLPSAEGAAEGAPCLFQLGDLPCVPRATADVGDSREALTSKLEAAGGSGCTAGPYCLNCTAVNAALFTVGAHEKSLAAFRSDFIGSPEFKSAHGRGARRLDLAADIAAKFFTLIPADVPAFSADALNAHTSESERKQLQKFLVQGSAWQWGMAPGKAFVGLDFLGLGTCRWTLQGFRRIIFVDAVALDKVLREDPRCAGFAPVPAISRAGGSESERRFSLGQLYEVLQSASVEQATALVASLGRSGSAMALTTGPADMVCAPAGWIVLECTMRNLACGYRWVRMETGALERLAALEELRQKPSSILALLRAFSGTAPPAVPAPSGGGAASSAADEAGAAAPQAATATQEQNEADGATQLPQGQNEADGDGAPQEQPEAAATAKELHEAEAAEEEQNKAAAAEEQNKAAAAAPPQEQNKAAAPQEQNKAAGAPPEPEQRHEAAAAGQQSEAAGQQSEAADPEAAAQKKEQNEAAATLKKHSEAAAPAAAPQAARREAAASQAPAPKQRQMQSRKK